MTVSCSTQRGPLAAFQRFQPRQRFTDDDIRVEWRVGSRPHGYAYWNRGFEGRVAWDRDTAMEVIEEIIEGEAESTILIARAQGNFLEFDIGGFGAAYDALMSRCGA